jgi:hypothetical protein
VLTQNDIYYTYEAIFVNKDRNFPLFYYLYLKICKSPIRVSQAGDACLALLIINFIERKLKGSLVSRRSPEKILNAHIEVSVLTHTLGSNYGFN